MSATRLTPGQRAAITTVGLLGVLGAAASVTFVLTSPFAEDKWLILSLLLVIGTAFTATGLYAWARRPDSRFGLQMCLVGLAWYANALTSSGSDVVFTIGLACGSLYAAFMIHTLLGFPTGRLGTPLERWFVVAAYVFAIGGQLVALMVTELPDDAPRNLLAIHDDDALSEAVRTAAQAASLAITVLVVVLLVARWRRATVPERRMLGPVLWSGVATCALLALALIGQFARLPGQVLNAFDVAGIVIFASVPFAFLFGIVRSNLTRGHSMGRLIARLGDGPRDRATGSLRDALATALHDRSLSLAYWMPDARRYVDAAGQPVTLPEPGSGRAFTEVERDGRRIAAIVHDASLDQEPELVRAAGAAAALALDNERLDAELRVQIAEVRASRRRLLEVVTRERRRIERDLHDGAQQRLVALALTLGIAENQVEADPEQARALIREARGEARLALEELRELARGIHPAILTDRGLGPALEALASRAPLPVELADVPQERLPAAVEGAAYFVVAEALANVAKYAEATHAEVIVQRVNGHAVVEVRDDGVGGANPRAGTGLRGLEDRLSALDGRLAVFSPSGRGTTIRAEIPCAS